MRHLSRYVYADPDPRVEALARLQYEMDCLPGTARVVAEIGQHVPLGGAGEGAFIGVESGVERVYWATYAHAPEAHLLLIVSPLHRLRNEGRLLDGPVVFARDDRDLSLRGAFVLARGTLPDLPHAIAISPAGDALALALFRLIVVQSIPDGVVLRKKERRDLCIEEVGFSPDGAFVVVGAKPSDALDSAPMDLFAFAVRGDVDADVPWHEPPRQRRWSQVEADKEPVPLGELSLSLEGDGVARDAELVLRRADGTRVARSVVAHAAMPEEVVVEPGGGIAHVRTKQGEVWTWNLRDRALVSRKPASQIDLESFRARSELVFDEPRSEGDSYAPRTIVARCRDDDPSASPRWSAKFPEWPRSGTTTVSEVPNQGLVAALARKISVYSIASGARCIGHPGDAHLVFLRSSDGVPVARVAGDSFARDSACIGVDSDGTTVVVAHRGTALSVVSLPPFARAPLPLRVTSSITQLAEVQHALAEGGQPPSAHKDLRRRQRELLATRGKEWSGLRGIARRVVFRLGRVDAVEVDADKLLENAARIEAAAPALRSLTITGLASDHDRINDIKTGPEPLQRFARVIELPLVRRMQGLALGNVGWNTMTESEFQPYWYESLDGEAAELLVSSGAFGHLRAFARTSPLVGLRLLLERGVLAHVERAWIGSDAAKLPAVRAMETWGPDVASLPATVRELALSAAGEKEIHALAISPAGPSIERLELRGGDLRRSPEVLAELPKLRSLVFADFPFAKAGKTDKDAMASFAATKMPALRELRISDTEDARDSLFEIARAFGPQLELLEIRGDFRTHGRPHEIESVVAGDVSFTSWGAPSQPIWVGGEMHEPWWDVGLVEL